MSTWKRRFENPTVIAASVASLTTLCITAVTAGSALWTAHIQSSAATENSIRETRRTLLIEAFKPVSPGTKLLAFIKSGVLTDDDCKLRIAILNYSSDCKPSSSPGLIPEEQRPSGN
jgi:hypothetical protein